MLISFEFLFISGRRSWTYFARINEAAALDAQSRARWWKVELREAAVGKDFDVAVLSLNLKWRQDKIKSISNADKITSRQ